MSAPNLVLSCFPGIGLLDRAFEQQGYCVVAGPDLIFGGDVRDFHPPAGVFEGCIGGPPCQAFSRLRHLRAALGQQPAENLIPEFERVVAEAKPDWFVMENVYDAPLPSVLGYLVWSDVLQNRWFGAEQHRARRISFGTRDGRPLDLSPSMVALESPTWERAVMATSAKSGKLARSRAALKSQRVGGGLLPGSQPSRTVAESARLQGLPEDFLAHAPFTQDGKRRVIGNGVPLPTGRAIAAAVRRAMGNARGATGMSEAQETDLPEIDDDDYDSYQCVECGDAITNPDRLGKWHCDGCVAAQRRELAGTTP